MSEPISNMATPGSSGWNIGCWLEDHCVIVTGAPGGIGRRHGDREGRRRSLGGGSIATTTTWCPP